MFYNKFCYPHVIWAAFTSAITHAITPPPLDPHVSVTPTGCSIGLPPVPNGKKKKKKRTGALLSCVWHHESCHEFHFVKCGPKGKGAVQVSQLYGWICLCDDQGPLASYECNSVLPHLRLLRPEQTMMRLFSCCCTSPEQWWSVLCFKS